MEFSNPDGYQVKSGESIEIISTEPEIASLCLEIEPDEKRRVLGCVISDYACGKGIADACVTLCTPDHVLLYGMRTDRNGCFCFDGLEEGRYSLTVSKNCFRTELLQVTAQEPCGAVPIEVTLCPDDTCCLFCPYTVCVTCKETGERVAGAAVQIRKSACSVQSRITSETGEAVFLLPDSWKQAELCISKSGFCTRYIGRYLLCGERECLYLYSRE